MTGKKVAGIVMTVLGYLSFTHMLMATFICGIIAIVFGIINASMQVDYNTEVSGYVYDVTASQTSLFYFDEDGYMYDKTFNITTSLVEVDDIVTVQYHDDNPSDIYVPELMGAFEKVAWFFCGFTVFLGIVPLGFWAIVLTVGVILLFKSKSAPKPVDNV